MADELKITVGGADSAVPDGDAEDAFKGAAGKARHARLSR